jgi:hypothetical protein
MKPYSGDPKCPECGDVGLGRVRYIAQTVTCEGFLERACGVCGHVWNEAPVVLVEGKPHVVQPIPDVGAVYVPAETVKAFRDCVEGGEKREQIRWFPYW